MSSRGSDERAPHPSGARAAGDARRVPYAPALDGLRAVCLIGVLLFHAPFAWMPGGFLGVSTFFTLSGYLITSLLLVEWDRTGGIDRSRFWERRLRRLGPALWLGVAATVVTSPLWLAEAVRDRLAWDATTSLLYVSNWRFMTPEYAYSRLFTDPSTLQHTWSLAIEAQFYLVFPALFVAVLRWGGRRALAPVFAVLTAASVASCWLLVISSDDTYRSYYGTDTRGAELLIGAMLAVALQQGRLASLVATPLRMGAVGSIAMAAMVATWVVAEVESAWLYRGGFGLYALLSAAVVLAAVGRVNPIQTILAATPLVWIGRLSYGAYVFHWPIFLWLDEQRTGLDLVPRFALQTAVTIGVSWLSYRFLEVPVRYGKRPSGIARVVAVSALVSLLISAVAGALHPSLWMSVDDQPALADSDPETDSDDRKFTFAMFGDSAALTVLPGTGHWLFARFMKTIPGELRLGCGLLEAGQRLTRQGWGNTPRKCRDWLERWRAVIEANPIDVAVVYTGTWDVLDRRLGDDRRVRSLGDPIIDRKLRNRMTAALEMFRRANVRVVWLTCPRMAFQPGKEPFDPEAASDFARVEHHNEILREVAARYPDDVRVVDFAAHIESLPGGPLDPEVRADGVHYSHSARHELAQWLGPQVLRAARDMIPPDMPAE